MTKFTIIRWNGPNSTAAIHHRKRRDTAGFMLRHEIYNMLAANALLDRSIAGQLMTQAQDWEASYNPRGKTDGKRIFRLNEHESVYIDWRRES